MVHDDDITLYLPRMRDGDDEAVEVIWRNYFEQLVRYARRKLEGVRTREADEEDVALSAMHSFWRGMKAGKFPKVEDREDLWKLLVTITARKATAQRRRQHAAKRGGGRLWGESFFEHRGDESQKEGIDQVAAEPSPDFADDVVANCRALLDVLEDSTLRQVALWTLEGYRPAEIAQRLGCARRTVERKIERIRTLWTRAGLAPGASPKPDQP